jgi:hypothetical protein
LNALAWVTGFRWRDGNLARFRWGEVSTGWGLALAVCKFEENWSLHLHLIYLNIFINLWRPRVEPTEMMETWGFSIPFDPDYGMFAAVHLSWGDVCKIIHMPWAWQFHRHSILAADGKHWIHELSAHRGKDAIGEPASLRWFSFSRDLPRWKKELPYRYVLRGAGSHRDDFRLRDGVALALVHVDGMAAQGEAHHRRGIQRRSGRAVRFLEGRLCRVRLRPAPR